jgi:hypothetical protein
VGQLRTIEMPSTLQELLVVGVLDHFTRLHRAPIAIVLLIIRRGRRRLE